ncbi:hypothetical protein U9M48_030799 [Paspalum notatum var. saurae]|uniref:Sulfotransferase n=1 Tax=Paspalum notatum var. saurae TaxID=547442 RepID=A0AAQ3U1Q2_PASNO
MPTTQGHPIPGPGADPPPAEAETTTNNLELCSHIPAMVSSLPSSHGLFSLPLYRHAQGWHASHVSMVGAMAADACFAARPTDILVVTLPKSGTTWIKSLLFATVRRGEHPPAAAADHPLSSSGPHECVRSLENQVYAHDEAPDLRGLPDPRLFATHVPYAALPRSVAAAAAGCKVVYVCRDPKDTLVSFWHFQNRIRAARGQEPLDVDAAAGFFCDGVSPFGPYWDHVLGYWRAHRDRPDRVLFLRYEQMWSDPAAHVRRLAEFAGLPFGGGDRDADEVDAVVRLCSFERLSGLEVNRAGKTRFVGGAALDNSYFFRRGVVGDWVNHLPVETARRIDAITEAKFKGSGLLLTM